MSIHQSFAEASALVSSGDHDLAIARYERALEALFEAGKRGLDHLEVDRDMILGAGDDLTDLLRWERRYSEAIALQEQLAALLPEEAGSRKVAAATFRIESGDVDAGFALLRRAVDELGTDAARVALGSTYLWAQDYEAAEVCLKTVAGGMGSDADRAGAWRYLFDVFNAQRRVDEATDAWEHAASLDRRLRDDPSPAVRMLIYWYHYDQARSYIDRDPNELRRTFYRSLIGFKTRPIYSRSEWKWALEYDPANFDGGHEELAEAALRSIEPAFALEIVMPFLARRELSRWRLLLVGLAWAQERKVERAAWAFDLAIRVGDIERPRGTRPGYGSERILDAASRITYGEIPIDSDVRKRLDGYFMPIERGH